MNSAPAAKGPTHINRRYLDEVDFGALLATGRKFHLTRSPCGTGKNHRLRRAFGEAAARGELVLGVSCRQSLAASMATDLGIANYLDIKTRDITVPAALCLDSLPRVPNITFAAEPEATPIKGFLLDEAQACFRHLFGGTIASKNQVGVIYRDLKRKFENSDLVIVQDADLDYLTLFALHTMSGVPIEELEASLVVNDWRPDNLRVNKFPSVAAWWKSLLAWGEIQKIACFCTTKAAVKKLSRDYRKKYHDKRILVIEGDQSGGAEVRAALADPSLFSQYDAIFYNSAMCNGVSIVIPDEFRVYGHLKAGTLIAQDCRQGLSRVRTPIDGTWNVVMLGHAPKKETNPNKIFADLLIPRKATIEKLKGITTMNPVYFPGTKKVERFEPEDLDLLWILAHKEAYEAEWGGTYHTVTKDDGTVVEGSFARLMRELGIPMVDAQDVDPDVKEVVEADLEAAKQEEDKDEVQRILAAEDSTDEEIELLEAQPRTLETTARIEAHKLRKFYGWKTLDEQKVEWDCKGKGRKLCAEFARFDLGCSGHEDVLLGKDAKDAEAGAVQLRNYWLEFETMRLLWKEVFGITVREAAENGLVLQPRKNILKSQTALDLLRRYLGMNFEKGESIMNLARSLAARIGIRLKPGKHLRIAGKRVQEYTINRDRFAEIEAYSANYRERLLDPKGSKPEVPDPLSQQRLQELVEAITAA